MAAQPYRSTVRRMTFFERATYTLTHLSANKIGALLLWAASVYTTYLLVASVHPDDAAYAMSHWRYIGWLLPAIDWHNVAIALAFQFVLTLGERSIWRGAPADAVASICLIIDIGTNAAGLYPYTIKFGDTQLWAMIADVLHTQSTFREVGGLILAIIGSIIVAAGPEKLWSRDAKKKTSDDEE